MKIKQLLKLLSILQRVEGRKALLSWKPFSITSFNLINHLKNLNFSFKTIIDGGANIGQFARAAGEAFPESKVISFEPLPNVAEKFRENLLNLSNRVQIFQTALGRKEGYILFHRNSHSHSSSVLELHKNHLKAFPDAQTISTLKVSVTTLDKALQKEQLPRPILLKLDLQGYELEALHGAIKTLKIVDAILLETSSKPMYKGEPSFKKIETFLNKKGFRFSQNLDFLEDSRGKVLQTDVLFLKK